MSVVMFTRAQARKSGLADLEEPTAGSSGATQFVRPTLEEAVGKPESSPTEPAGPVPVPATQGLLQPARAGAEQVDRRDSPSREFPWDVPAVRPVRHRSNGRRGHPVNGGRVHPLDWPLTTICTKRPRQTVTRPTQV